MNMVHSQVVDRMIDYLKTVLENPHPVFGGMPICPFSRKSRLANRILYYVYPFSSIDLDSATELIQQIQDFPHLPQYDLMLIIHPDPQALTLDQTHEFTHGLNYHLAALDILAFDGHPDDDFNIQGVFTRKAPYIHLTIQMVQKVKEASDQLLKTSYYQHWSAEHFQYVGMPRG